MGRRAYPAGERPPTDEERPTLLAGQLTARHGWVAPGYDLSIPEVSVRRGGIRYGEGQQPPGVAKQRVPWQIRQHQVRLWVAWAALGLVMICWTALAWSLWPDLGWKAVALSIGTGTAPAVLVGMAIGMAQADLRQARRREE